MVAAAVHPKILALVHFSSRYTSTASHVQDAKEFFDGETKVAVIVYSVVCGLHGLLFGIIYAPSQAILFGFTLTQTIAWIANGLLFDVFHCIGNIAFSTLAYPLTDLLYKLENRASKKLS